MYIINNGIELFSANVLQMSRDFIQNANISRSQMRIDDASDSHSVRFGWNPGLVH